jgi:hypothetical protein
MAPPTFPPSSYGFLDSGHRELTRVPNKNTKGRRVRPRKGKRNPSQKRSGGLIASNQQVARQLSGSWNKIHNFFIADGTLRTILSDGISDSIYNYTFQLGDCDIYLELAKSFQFYKIMEVSVVYEPIITQVVTFASEGANTFVPPNIVYSFRPYSTVPVSYADTVQRGDAVITSSMRQWRTSIRPVPLVRAFDSLTSDGFLNMGPQWITTTKTDVPHYGLSIAMQPSGGLGGTPDFGGRLTFYYQIQFRNPVVAP